MSTTIVCAHCGNRCVKRTGHVNVALRAGRPMYCSRACSGAARQMHENLACSQCGCVIREKGHAARRRRRMAAGETVFCGNSCALTHRNAALSPTDGRLERNRARACAYMVDYRQRPGVAERRAQWEREYLTKPSVQDRRNERARSPERRATQAVYRTSPGRISRRAELRAQRVYGEFWEAVLLLRELESELEEMS